MSSATHPNTTPHRLMPKINDKRDNSPVDGNFLATMQSGAHPSRYYVHNALPTEVAPHRRRAGSMSPSPEKEQDRAEITKKHKEAIHSNPVALENFYRDLTYKEKVLKVRQKRVYQEDLDQLKKKVTEPLSLKNTIAL